MSAISSPEIQALVNRKENPLKLRSIATNSERFKTFSFGHFTVSDSAAFMAKSLSELIEKLGPNERPHITELAEAWAEKQGVAVEVVQEVLRGKLLFAYEAKWFKNLDLPIDYVTDNFENLLQNGCSITATNRLGDVQLQTKEIKEKATKSKTELKEELVKICETMKLKTWGDLLRLYLGMDIAGLADVLVSFRKTSMTGYTLPGKRAIDPFCCMGAPMYALNVYLQRSDIHIGLIQKKEDYCWFESAKRGGTLQVHDQLRSDARASRCRDHQSAPCYGVPTKRTRRGLY